MTEIFDINDLREAIDNDTGFHRIKDLAELLWSAMNDWPTQNQTIIADFKKELYDYFGFPLTIDKINQKKLDINIDENVWRQESGASIAEIIEISTRFDNVSDFEKILNQILTHYSIKKNI